MSKKKATSSDVAKRAGVSQATVSMVLNKKYNVSFSRETVEKVEQAARELGYHLPGRKNRKESRKEKLIVVFCPTLTSPYYVLLLQGIEAVANKQGYGVFICNTQRDPRLEEKYLRMMGTIEPLGIIYCCNPNPDFQQQVEELAQTIPLVIISNKEKTTTIDAINQDNTVVGRMMARHLLDLGHRDVAFITPPLTRRQWQRTKRVNGFVKEFEKEGLKDHVIIKAADEAIDRPILKPPGYASQIQKQGYASQAQEPECAAQAQKPPDVQVLPLLTPPEFPLTPPLLPVGHFLIIRLPSASTRLPSLSSSLSDMEVLFKCPLNPSHNSVSGTVPSSDSSGTTFRYGRSSERIPCAIYCG